MKVYYVLLAILLAAGGFGSKCLQCSGEGACNSTSVALVDCHLDHDPSVKGDIKCIDVNLDLGTKVSAFKSCLFLRDGITEDDYCKQFEAYSVVKKCLITKPVDK